MRNICGISSLVVVCGLCASFASAQQSWRDDGNSKTTISMQSSDGSDTFEVRVTDGKVTAKHNGEIVPEDRIKRTENGDEVTIEILDEAGNVLKKFDLNKATSPHIRLQGTGATAWTATAPKARSGFRAAEPVEGMAFAVAPEMDNPPPVMVGVTMSEPEASVLEFLKLEHGVVFDRVIDGLPAAKAGVKAGDILVEVKGEKGVDSMRFRDILRETKAGDELEIKVARAGGEIHTLKLSLVAFDAKALGREEAGAIELDESPIEVYSHGGAHKNWEQAHTAIAEALANLKQHHGLDDKVQKSIKESLTKAMESLAEAKDSLRDVQIFSNNGQWDQATPKLRMTPGGQNKLMVVPRVPEVPALPGMNSERIEKLEKKVDDLNKKLDAMMELLKDRK